MLVTVAWRRILSASVVEAVGLLNDGTERARFGGTRGCACFGSCTCQQ